MKLFDKESLFRLNQILVDYDIIEGIHLDSKVSNTIYLGEDRKICRFCGFKHPEVTFLNVAHAIPEFFGNKFLLSHYECDTCNKFFGGTIETDMANLMQICHLASGVRGKKSHIPEYKRSGVSAISNGKHFTIRNVDIKGDIDKNFEIDFTSPSFTPIGVYKCLTKIALTIMPEDQMQYCQTTLDWIREENNINSKYTFENLFAIYSSTLNRFPFISSTLFKRKQLRRQDIPAFIFRITYANYSFQSFIPLTKLDSNTSFEPQKLPCVPHLIDVQNGWKITEKDYIDFNIKDKVSKTTVLKIFPSKFK